MLPKETARSCFKRDNYQCRHCKNRNGLHPHHLIYKSHGGTDDFSNLLTLCATCHRAHHDNFLTIIILTTGMDNAIVRFVRNRGWKP